MLYLKWFSCNPFKADCFTVVQLQERSEQINRQLSKVVAESSAIEKRIKEKNTVSLSELSQVASLEKRLAFLQFQAQRLEALSRETIAIEA